ncbi:Succinate dehydrogenase flavoprotein subunit [Lachnospiraceae bacterium TWA4]|nr:Succinate dehydrogenase flavoprotein subunit [Lachnospiraceae bacterium TWA4]
MFLELVLDSKKDCKGCKVQNTYNGEIFTLYGSVILASGGMSGLFPGHCTGTVENDTCVASTVFSQGVKLGNLEFIQYHPTTVRISGKQYLISEAARSEGGRFYILRNGKPWYFLEDLYGENGNLLSRDQVVKEIWNVQRREDCEKTVYLDMRGIPSDEWDNRLFGMRDICIEYLGQDPKKEPIPIQSGMHYFMGGILVDKNHRTNLKHLYAAGECACIYHGASRLGGNSLLGAVYGGYIAAKSALEEAIEPVGEVKKESGELLRKDEYLSKEIGDILRKSMDVIRDEASLKEGYEKILKLHQEGNLPFVEKNKVVLGLAMLQSAIDRKESRAAHVRIDYPEMKEAFRKVTVSQYDGKKVHVWFEEP